MDRASLAQARRLEALTTSLLRLSHLEAGEAAPRRERIDLTALTRQRADALASRADQAEVELRLDLPVDAIDVVGSTDRLRTALGNPLDNALKFTGNKLEY